MSSRSASSATFALNAASNFLLCARFRHLDRSIRFDRARRSATPLTSKTGVHFTWPCAERAFAERSNLKSIFRFIKFVGVIVPDVERRQEAPSRATPTSRHRHSAGLPAPIKSLASTCPKPEVSRPHFVAVAVRPCLTPRGERPGDDHPGRGDRRRPGRIPDDRGLLAIPRALAVGRDRSAAVGLSRLTAPARAASPPA